MRPGRIAGLLLPAAVSVTLLVLLMRGGSWADLGASIARAPRSALAVYALVSAAGLWLRAVRFRLLLARPRPATGSILLVTLVQNCLGDLVPGRLAALGSYVYLLVRRLGVGLEPAAATFFLSFVFELATLGPVLALAALVRLDAGALSSRLPLGGIVAAGAVLFLAAAVALRELGPVTRALSGIVRGAAPAPPPAAKSRRREFAARLDSLAGAMGEVRRAGTLVPVFLVSVVIRLAKYVSLYSLMTGLLAGAGAVGRRPDFWDLILAITATELVASLPIPALGQFGVWEGGMAGALVLLGFERGPAILVAVGIHGIAQAYEYLLGVVAFWLLALLSRRTRD
jgi:hypothetical protein